MNVLVVGSGGREHALLWRIAQDPVDSVLFCAPGNAGTSQVATNLPVAVTDIDGLLVAVGSHQIDLVIIGPEQPLSAGLADRLRAVGVLCVGPNQAAAELEASKGFAKQLMHDLGVPTAHFAVAHDREMARAAVERIGVPLVLKADGLAAGKGVVICNTLDLAFETIDQMMVDERFGDAGRRIVIEDFLVGDEASYIVLTDGVRVLPLATSKDHKAALDGDRGPNTGGMGAYSPAISIDAELEKLVLSTIIQPVVDEMRAQGRRLNGFLYAGLMLTPAGPQVLEFNVRLGDPETQPLMMRVEGDFLAALLATARQDLGKTSLQWSTEPAVCVVMTSAGYPGSYQIGKPIDGVELVPDTETSVVFHAGTANEDGQTVTSGGRVLGICARGNSLRDAIARAYATVEKIDFEGATYRSDIGRKAINGV